MVTNYPRIASHDGLQSAGETHAERSGTSLFGWLRQTWCGLHGHDNLLHFEHKRMSLSCVSCGYETPGWTLTEVPPTITVHGDARRHVIKRPQLVDTRRIA